MSMIDWNSAPEWAEAHGSVSVLTTRNIWFNDKVYMYVGDSRSYQWTDGSPDLRHNHGQRSVSNVQLRPTAWTGEGLPPVGTICDVIPHNTMWGLDTLDPVRMTICGYFHDYVWLRDELDRFHYTRTDKADFRPIRTPEQIAAEEREAAIIEMLKDAGKQEGPNARHQATVLYNAGWRKQESDK